MILQVGLDEVEEYTKGEVWVECLRQEAYHRLRTQQQLGYIVALANWSNHIVASIVFILQSSIYAAEPTAIDGEDGYHATPYRDDATKIAKSAARNSTKGSSTMDPGGISEPYTWLTRMEGTPSS